MEELSLVPCGETLEVKKTLSLHIYEFKFYVKFLKKNYFLHTLKASCISSVSDLHSMAFWTSIRNRIRIQITKLKNSKKIYKKLPTKIFSSCKT